MRKKDAHASRRQAQQGRQAFDLRTVRVVAVGQNEWRERVDDQERGPMALVPMEGGLNQGQALVRAHLFPDRIGNPLILVEFHM